MIHFIFLVIEASNVQQPKLQLESEQNLTDNSGEKCHLFNCSIPEAFDLCKLTCTTRLQGKEIKTRLIDKMKTLYRYNFDKIFMKKMEIVVLRKIWI